MLKKDEPSIQHYWFGKAYRDMWEAIRDSQNRNLDTARDYWRKAKSGTGNAAEVAIPYLFYGTSAGAVVVFGTLVWLILVPIHIVIVGSIALCIAVTFLTLDFIERGYLLFKGWTTVCPHCGEKVALPAFQCANPACGKWHYHLRPSSFGIFKHQCKCGQKLPSTFLSDRQKLKARCPHELCEKILDAEVALCSSTSVISIIGPPGAGKTGFMIAAMEILLNKIAPKNFLTGRFTDLDSEHFFVDEMKYITSTGSTRKTANHKPPAFNALFESSKRNISHQVYLFDAAGEIFLSSDKLSNHHQFKNITGGIIIIDPFSLPALHRKYDAVLKKDGIAASISKDDVIDVIDRFVIGLQRHFGLKHNQKISQPYAVILTKGDLFNLRKIFYSGSVGSGMTQQEERKRVDQEVRQKLNEWGAAALVNTIDTRFSNTMFFCVAPINLRKKSMGYDAELSCVGIMDPLMWILESSKAPIVER
ncbi:TRAFAC clade GTPase domain-containing protein [Gimesia maris]|uniref:Double-GTPase 2 domain-containing protein n=1 Tax=Gimesia maris TaxID=122 RepID=A0ABX5YRN4_9PLAN|nr:hypothetical protein [Gimesia maris]EDL59227.1 hypothetical protein PM8797T_23309 [Gimesia maris DSM 8797]QEG18230.1 hypothetical protein GmarT_41160 [Gimesia maris]QGQ28771.1 hypothetical protein F1729_09010 [Gimesia maris]